MILYLITGICIVSIFACYILRKKYKINQYSDQLSNESHPCALVDSSGKIIDFNNSFGNLFILDDESKKDLDIFNFINPHHKETSVLMLKLLLKSQNKDFALNYNLTDSTKNIFQSFIEITPTENGKVRKPHYFLKVTDTSEDIDNKNIDLQDSSSHRINNLLTILMGSIQILKSQAMSTDSSEEIRAKVSKQVNNAQVAIKEICTITQENDETLVNEIA